MTLMEGDHLARAAARCLIESNALVEQNTVRLHSRRRSVANNSLFQAFVPIRCTQRRKAEAVSRVALRGFFAALKNDRGMIYTKSSNFNCTSAFFPWRP